MYVVILPKCALNNDKLLELEKQIWYLKSPKYKSHIFVARQRCRTTKVSHSKHVIRYHHLIFENQTDTNQEFEISAILDMKVHWKRELNLGKIT